MTIIIFIIVLLVTVIAHERGHFIVARKSGMRVEEFGFGIPPRLFAWKRGETEYSINALPIGGFVKIAGENGLENNQPTEGQFESKPWYLKSAVLVAGVVCNVILAFVLFTAAYMIGMPAASDTGTPTIVSVVSGSPAEKAGLKAGDTIHAITIGDNTIAPISTNILHEAIINSMDPVTVTYVHNDVQNTAELIPQTDSGNRMIGIGIESIGVLRQSLFDAMKSALWQIKNIVSDIVTTLGSLIGGLFAHNGSAAGLTGPVGLAHAVGNAATIGFAYLIAFTAAISLNLAVINILPFPALDGGRLLIVLLEALFRRRFSRKVVTVIHTMGFLMLLGLMLFLTVGDVAKLL